jgi:heme-degrading monooxygenase HmoA
MPYTVSRAKVEDYDKFRQNFFSEGVIALRQAHGSRGARLFRSSGDPKEIIVLGEWDDLENARRFLQSNELQEQQQRGGVVEVVRYEEVEHS